MNDRVLRRYVIVRLARSGALLLIALIMGTITYLHATDARAFERDAITARGRVVELFPDELVPRVAVRFDAEGRRHEAKAPVYDAGRYRVGQSVRVFYLVSDPSARIEIVGDLYDAGTPATFAAILFIIALLHISRAVRWTRRLTTVAGRAEPTYRMRAITWCRAPTDRWWASLQPVDASEDALPLVSIPLLAGQEVASLPSQLAVEVRGEPRDRAVLVLRAGDVILWARGRARTGKRFARATSKHWKRGRQTDEELPLSRDNASFVTSHTPEESRVSADDPGWNPVFRQLLSSPALMVRPHSFREQALQMPLLVSMRMMFALLSIGLLVWAAPVVLATRAGSSLNWVYLSALTASIGMSAASVLKRNRLDTSTIESLATSYQRRFFGSLAFADMPAIVGAAISMLSGWWFWYVIGMMVSILARRRIAPTRTHLEREAMSLQAGGCPWPLLDALMLPVGRIVEYRRATRRARSGPEATPDTPPGGRLDPD